MRNFTDTSWRVSNPREDLLPPLRLTASAPVWELRSPSVTQSLCCPLSLLCIIASMLPSLCSAYFAPDLQTNANTLSFLLTYNSPSDSIFSYRTSTNEKIDFTWVTKYLHLVYFPNAPQCPSYNLPVENERPRLDSNQRLRSFGLDLRLLLEVITTV